jgi:beta-glucosidase-like glycosyl hydrolase
VDKDDLDGVITPDIKFQLVRKIEGHKIIGLNGPSLLPHEEKYIEFHKPAGVILFERNVESIPQVGELVSGIKRLLSAEGLDPLIMVDHEGDLVSSLRKIIGTPPAPMAVAATGDIDLARRTAEATGEAILKLGVNVILGPSADCCFDLRSPVTGLRSFGADPELVADYVAATIAGYHDAGLLVCVKHFPGHGSSSEDSHTTLPVVDKTLEKLREEDLVPFARAFQAGSDMCMLAHVSYRLKEGEEPGEPASFDRFMIRDLLRGEMGFEGVAITDALEMEGALSHAMGRYGGLAGGLERPLLAGVDLLLYGRPLPERMVIGEDGESVMSLRVMETIIHTLERVVDRARIERKLEEAAAKSEGLRKLLDIFRDSEERVAALRAKASASALPPREPERGKVIELSDYPTVPAVYETVAAKSVALVRDPAGVLPFEPGSSCLVVPVLHNPDGGIGRVEIDDFVDVLLKRFPAWRRTAEVTGFELDPDGRAVARFARAKGRRFSPLVEEGSTENDEIVLVFAARGGLSQDYIENFRDFLARFGCRLVILAGWPHVDWIPSYTGVMVTFGSSRQAASAAARVLSGEMEPQGRIEHVRPRSS